MITVIYIITGDIKKAFILGGVLDFGIISLLSILNQ
jgi:hypothetical protein